MPGYVWTIFTDKNIGGRYRGGKSSALEELKSLVLECRTMNEADYTAESWEALLTVLSEADTFWKMPNERRCADGW